MAGTNRNALCRAEDRVGRTTSSDLARPGRLSAGAISKTISVKADEYIFLYM